MNSFQPDLAPAGMYLYLRPPQSPHPFSLSPCSPWGWHAGRSRSSPNHAPGEQSPGSVGGGHSRFSNVTSSPVNALDSKQPKHKLGKGGRGEKVPVDTLRKILFLLLPQTPVNAAECKVVIIVKRKKRWYTQTQHTHTHNRKCKGKEKFPDPDSRADGPRRARRNPGPRAPCRPTSPRLPRVCISPPSHSSHKGPLAHSCCSKRRAWGVWGRGRVPRDVRRDRACAACDMQPYRARSSPPPPPPPSLRFCRRLLCDADPDPDLVCARLFLVCVICWFRCCSSFCVRKDSCVCARAGRHMCVCV
ncbi:hypothetical protein F5883DRAFT_140102 [Diaporthe sp. PMI_573]|nr:hypothetical protein F5883DRAFT_140102 [Diaporthaceae sp. PMI_573]